ncbi:MAG: phosphoribosylglycinamide formyltransferase [Euryarchaeota archaeon]|nr:phosphoribosylglycinamide formyltransferase [Euryarchaeota archaeon]|tara:strand:- start:4242 stop:4886 length:645 start_codon:yes stop_codon:yes gene_type:complete
MGGIQLLSRNGSPSHPIRIAVFFSGSGTGMNALLEHQTRSDCVHTTVVCVTDKKDAKGVDFARKYNLPVIIESVDVNVPREERRREQEMRIEQELLEYDVDLIVLSGYMRILTPQFVENFYPRIVNIHPSLLPAFPGADAHTDVLASGVLVSGCTVHVVDAGMDTGTILAQCRVPVFENDTRPHLAKRVQIEEHRVYPKVIDLICSGHQFDLDD